MFQTHTKWLGTGAGHAAAFLFVTLAVIGLWPTAGRAQVPSPACLRDGGNSLCTSPMPGDWHCTAGTCGGGPGSSSTPGCNADVSSSNQVCGTEAQAWQVAAGNLAANLQSWNLVKCAELSAGLYADQNGVGVHNSSRRFGLLSHYDDAYNVQFGAAAYAGASCQTYSLVFQPNGGGSGGSCSGPSAGCSRWIECPAGSAPDAANTYCHQIPPCDHCNPVKVGDPIQPATGEQTLAEPDISLGGTPALEFIRYYTSGGFFTPPGVERDGSVLGTVWHHTYQRSIVVDPGTGTQATYAYAVRANGEYRPFRQSGTNWIGRPDETEKLTQNSSGWTYVTSDEDIEQYNAAGALQSITSRSGRTLSLTYSTASTPGTIAPRADLLIAVTNDLGRSIQLSYDASARLTKVVDASGANYVYRYDPSGHLSFVDYPGGGTRQYLYNEYGYASSQYNGVTTPNLLTGVVDENQQRYISTQYEWSGGLVMASASWHGSNFGKTRLQYYGISGSTAQTLVIDALNNRDMHKFAVVNGYIKDAGDSRCTSADCSRSIVTSIAYDTTGYLQSKTDYNGRLTNYTYDGTRGLETQRTEAVGKPEQRTTTTVWNANFRLPDQRSVANAGGLLETITKWTYNARGQITARCQTDPAVGAAVSYACGASANAPAGVRQWRYTYCEPSDVSAGTCPVVGLVTSVDGPRTDVSDITTYSYYQTTNESGCATAGGPCHRLGDLYRVTNALGQTTTYVSYDKNGKVTRIQDANGVYTDMTFHPRGWLLTRTVRAHASGTPNATLDATTTLAYDNVGNVTQVTQPDGSYVHYVYDDAHRLTDIYDGAVPVSYLQGNHIHYTLDAAGNRTDEKTSDGGGTLKRELSRTYDQLSHLTALVNSNNVAVQTYTNPAEMPPSGVTYTNGYDGNGNPVYSVDGTGLHVGTEQQYDPLDRLVKILRDHAGTGATHDTTTQYAFDTRDNLRSVTDPDGLVTSYTYDGLDNLTDLSSPDSGHTVYTYDAAGNRTTQTDARGVTSTYSYDVLNRLAGISYPTSSLNVTYAYDQADSATGCDGSYSVGRLTTMTDSSGSTTYCYDQHGNVVAKKQVTGAIEIDFQYAYNVADRLLSITYPSGNQVLYSRDNLGRIVGVDYLVPSGIAPLTYYAETQIVSDMTYYPFGPVNSITFNYGPTLTKAYDRDYAIDGVASSLPAGLSIDTSVDVLGNLVNASSIPGAYPPTRSYQYDPLYRLQNVSAGSSPLEAYTYNKTGDRLSKSLNGGAVQTYSYGAPQTSHRLLSVAGSQRSYDANGNTTLRGGATLVYDDRNRLVQAGGWTYGYNGRGERVIKHLAGALPATEGTIVSTAFGYANDGALLVDFAEVTSCIRSRTGACTMNTRWGAQNEYIWADGTLVGVAVGGAIYYVETDQLGTPRRVVNLSDNSVAWSWDYFASAFGENAPNEDPGNTGSSFKFNLRFPGQYYDSETGLSYNYSRDYDPSTGRYVESDPIGIAGGLATYAYVEANALRYRDANGMAAETAGSDSSARDSETEKARAEAVEKLKKCDMGKCYPGLEKYYSRKDDLEYTTNNLHTMKIVYNPNLPVCGYTQQYQYQRIEIGPSAFSPEKCCSLASTLAHEASHLGRNWNGQRGSEERSEYLELKCFNCGRSK